MTCRLLEDFVLSMHNICSIYTHLWPCFFLSHYLTDWDATDLFLTLFCCLWETKMFTIFEMVNFNELSCYNMSVFSLLITLYHFQGELVINKKKHLTASEIIVGPCFDNTIGLAYFRLAISSFLNKIYTLFRKVYIIDSIISNVEITVDHNSHSFLFNTRWYLS